jgi:hypothetical protein
VGATGAPGATGPAGAFGTAFYSFSGTYGVAGGGPLAINTASADNSSNGDIVVSDTMTVTVANSGFYLVTYQVGFTPDNSSGVAGASLYINQVSDPSTVSSGSFTGLATLATLTRGYVGTRYFNAGDTISVFGTQYAATTTEVLTFTKLQIG